MANHVRSVQTLDLSDGLTNAEVIVGSGNVATITALTDGCVITVRENESGDGFSRDVCSRIATCKSTIARLFISAAAQAGSVEITVHDADFEIRPFGKASTTAPTLLATITHGAHDTANLFAGSDGRFLNDGTDVQYVGGGTCLVTHDDTLGLEGFRVEAKLNSGASIPRAVLFTHLTAPLKALFSPAGAVPRTGMLSRYGKYHLRDTLFLDVLSFAGSGNRNAFFGWGGQSPWGLGFFGNKLQSGNWRAYIRNHPGVSPTVYADVDLGVPFNEAHEMDLVIGADSGGPFAEFWIDGVRRYTHTGTLAAMDWGASVPHACYCVNAGSSLASDGTKASLWAMLNGALRWEYEAA